MRAPSRGGRLLAAATRSISSPPKIRSVADAASHGLGGPPPAKQRMDLASTPNVLITSSGLNSAQAIRDLTAAVYDAGDSIAASKKVVLGSHYSLLMALWLPEATPASAAATLSKTLEAHVAGGASLSVVPLECTGGGCRLIVDAQLRCITRRAQMNNLERVEGYPQSIRGIDSFHSAAQWAKGLGNAPCAGLEITRSEVRKLRRRALGRKVLKAIGRREAMRQRGHQVRYAEFTLSRHDEQRDMHNGRIAGR